MKRFFDIYPQVFYPSIVLIFGFILLSVLGGEPVRIFFAEASQAITQKTGWLFILGVNFFIGYSLWLAFGKFGQVRIGGPKAIPEFSLFSWFSMLFSAGMGIGLLYLVSMIMNMFGSSIGFIHSNGLFGIGFSLFVVAIAALNLVLDFDFIEQGSEQGAPKYMEWFGAFSLMVTLIWLYLEMLRLLAKMRSR